ncbi:MAG: regulatory protein GemA [Deltaproteobacteria bacterium]|nr:regulatory protein GemA [Deltaproteobacteria bacterium]
MPTKEQLALLHVAKAKLGLSDDTYRDILHVQGGVASAKDLGARGFEAVLKRFRELGFRRRSPARTTKAAAAPGDPPSPLQLSKIRHLWEDLGWREEERRRGFAKRVCGGHPWPQTVEEAAALIEALKKMRGRGYSERTPRRPRATSGSAPSGSRGSGA